MQGEEDEGEVRGVRGMLKLDVKDLWAWLLSSSEPLLAGAVGENREGFKSQGEREIVVTFGV